MGERVGTSADIGGTFQGAFKSGQLDRVDEAVKTTVYLSLIEDDGLLKWHTLGAPADRNPFTGACCWPHKTAVVVVTSSRSSYAVNSWFHHNGVPAEVVTLTDWLSGWKPPGATDPTSQPIPPRTNPTRHKPQKKGPAHGLGGQDERGALRKRTKYLVLPSI